MKDEATKDSKLIASLLLILVSPCQQAVIKGIKTIDNLISGDHEMKRRLLDLKGPQVLMICLQQPELVMKAGGPLTELMS